MSIAVVSILPGASPRLGPNAVARRRVSIRGGRQSSAAPIVLRAMAAPAGAHVSGAPADLSDDAVRSMREEAVSWAAQHGLLVCLESDESGRAMCASFTHAPMSLLPTPFPRDVFELALRVSPSFAALSDAVSRDDEFLRTTLAGVVKTDDFTRRIWDIYERCGGQEGRHPMELGILRSDYMLDEPSGLPLQVEVNTVSTSFMALSTKVGEMHRHTISHAGLIRHYADEDADKDEDGEKDEDANLDDEAKLRRVLPLNRALECAADTLAAGWRAMNEDDAKILFVVQPNERNVFDQRIIAQRLWTKHGVASIRATLREIDANAAVDQTTKRLTYGASDGRRDAISVVYYRAGYAPTDYPGEEEWRARELLEESSAVKSPSAAMHLAGCKKIQQALAQPGVLERFVDDVGECADMRKVFAGLYAMDGEEAMEAVKLGLENPGAYVLKPQREGGGNNLYGDELVDALKTYDPAASPGEPGDLSAYILMQRIFPPSHSTLCLRGGELVRLETLSELGVYGGYLRVGDAVVMNEVGGHLLRTKAATSDEGGVAAGYAVLDSPLLY